MRNKKQPVNTKSVTILNTYILMWSYIDSNVEDINIDVGTLISVTFVIALSVCQGVFRMPINRAFARFTRGC